MLTVTIGATVLKATLTQNSSSQALIDLLKKGPLTVQMNDYGDFEKVGDLHHKLPRNDQQITTGPGDIILYEGHFITFYYSTNSWRFTRLGKFEITSESELRKIFGPGDITAVLSLSE